MTARKLLQEDSPLRILNRDALKWIALVLMTAGHFWSVYRHHIPRQLNLPALVLQHFAPPVFFFFIAEGFHYTRSRKKYALRLLIFAVITQIPHALGKNGIVLHDVFLFWSVLLVLFLGLISLMILHSSRKLPLRLAEIAALCGVSILLHAEWGATGILAILCMDLLRERPLIRLCVIPLLVVIHNIVLAGGLILTRLVAGMILMWVLAMLLITFCYNGKKGHFPRFSQYAFYVWYPLHLLIRWVLQSVISV